MEILDLNQQLKKYRIKPEEYDLICSLLGRPPQGVEWALYSALWSEHCSYKSSRVHLKKFKSTDARIRTAEGENAGVLDLGEDEAIAFKMESHNHPSFIEPFHGAATGVGGILRDIFTMGARPIALANYLCFGESKQERMPYLMKNVVKGISFYGNCVGVPTVTGATHSLPEYNNNILVNAFALGLFTKDQRLTISKASGPGNDVVYVGAKTGSDGVHGASMASESFEGDMEVKRPTIQIGDPFYEKLLIEACLEILDQNLVVAMQDMGAAGLTSSSFEMASRGQVGFDLDLSLVPLRDSKMGPEEILLSESQERMLLICEPEKFEAIQNIFKRWGLEASRIGKVTSDKKIKLKWKGETICHIDPGLIVEKSPQYERPYSPLKVQSLSRLEKFFGSATRDSKKWIYRQYDQRVGLRTEREAGHPAAFVRLPSGRALSMALGCRPWLMKEDPALGAYDSVLEPAIKMIISGAWPQGITDCLNFGNPEKPEIMSQFVASVEAIAHTSKLLNAPVISGNVSFYNETEGVNIPPTPGVGVVGLRAQDYPLIQDRFVKENSTVGLVTLQSLKDEFNPEDVVDKLKEIFELFRKGQVFSARLVTEKGLENTLFWMSCGGLSLQNLPNLPKAFYQIVVEAEDNFWKGFKLDYQVIGKTMKSQNSFSARSLEENFERSWSVT